MSENQDPADIENQNDQNDPNFKIKQTQAKVGEVKETAMQAIEKAIQRGESLDEIQEKADSLEQNAYKYKINTSTIKNKMWCQKCKANLIIALIVIIVIIVIALIIWGATR